jgi:hypothetical protein
MTPLVADRVLVRTARHQMTGRSRGDDPGFKRSRNLHATGSRRILNELALHQSDGTSTANGRQRAARFT